MGGPPWGPGGLGSSENHHRRLKTRLTVRMMPKRRTKGSHVFTKAPTLTGESTGAQSGEQADGPEPSLSFRPNRVEGPRRVLKLIPQFSLPRDRASPDAYSGGHGGSKWTESHWHPVTRDQGLPFEGETHRRLEMDGQRQRATSQGLNSCLALS